MGYTSRRFGGLLTRCSLRQLLSFGVERQRHEHIPSLEQNPASIRVLQKCGFTLEGKLRNYRMVRGEPRDFIVFPWVPGHPAADTSRS